MSYFFSKKVTASFDEAVAKAIAELKGEGFGILTEINFKQTLENKLNVDFRRYKILGACNPPYAYKALMADEIIDTMLPCNVIVQEFADGQVEVTAIDPMASMQAVKNPALETIIERL